MELSPLLLDAAEASVLIEGGAIAEVGAAIGAPEVARLDCAGGSISVGAVNAHTHLYSGLVPLGMPAPEPPPTNFVQILERVWWRLDRALDAASLRASARLYIAEALLSGTTSLIDHHESPGLIEGSLDILADAADELGIRLLVCYGATERNHGLREAREGLAECGRFIRDNGRPLVRGVVGLHASFTMSDEGIREAGELARELEVPMHVHVAEDVADVADAKLRGYEGVLDRLMTLEALPPGSILAHGVHFTAEEVRRAEDAHCWFVQNPRSNEGNAVGYPSLLGASERAALGTDGYPANMADEQRALERIAEEHGDEAGRHAGASRAEAARRLASERFGVALAAEPTVGIGADLRVTGQGDERPRHVLVAGKQVVRDGVLLTADIEQIRADAEQQAAGLWERMRAI